jgi:DNA repair exonuclease SbcCD ATPase subunit
MYDEEKKKSMELQSEINTLKAQINTKVKENQNLNNQILLLANQLEEINQENNVLYENNDIFYQNFLALISDFKELNLFNVQLPNYSTEDEQGKRYEDIIYTIDVVINIIQELSDNTNDK